MNHIANKGTMNYISHEALQINQLTQEQPFNINNINIYVQSLLHSKCFMGV